MDIIQLAMVLLSFVGIILLGVTYFYIDKLEKMPCECARHPYQRFVKTYPLFAIAYLALTMFLLPSVGAGKMLGGVLAVAQFIYTIATIAFFIMALMYIRYLKAAKCACSESMTREIIYIWSILELVILLSLIVVGVIMFIVSGAFALAVGTVGKVNDSARTVQEAAVNPLKSARKVPGALRKTLKSLKMK